MLSPGLPLRESSKIYKYDNSFWIYCGVRTVTLLKLTQTEHIAEICIIFSFSWASYKINQIQDKIGVFVSIVSTKIPFKGTGKEYIGDDITEIATAVKVGILVFIFMSYWENVS